MSNSTGFIDFYLLLGISPNSNQKEISRAYRLKALEVHPDKIINRNEEEVGYFY